MVLNVVYPSAFHVGGPSTALRVISIVALIAGVTIWVWSVVLILRKVPKGELITTGPFRLVKHPLYTGVALLVLPWIGFLFNTWLGAAIGIILYLGSRRFAPEEEAELSETFGPGVGRLLQHGHDPLAIGRRSSRSSPRCGTDRCAARRSAAVSARSSALWADCQCWWVVRAR